MNIKGIVERYGTPLYVYREETIKKKAKVLRESVKYQRCKFLYACKANTNIHIMKILKKEGFGLDVSSPFELDMGLEAGFRPEDILYTGDNISGEEMEYVLSRKVLMNIGSLSQLSRYGKLNRGGEISIRLNPDCGAGHHRHTITGGEKSKFGIFYSQEEEVQNRLKEYGLKLVGIHSHIGSGILEVKELMRAVEMILKSAKVYEGLEMINIGGGLGIPYREGEEELDVESWGEEVGRYFEEFCRGYGEGLELWIEPGRYLVGESGVLLTEVININETSGYRFVGVDTGFNHLLRPILYGSYHKIWNYTKEREVKEEVVISGNMCESGDILTQEEGFWQARNMGRIEEGDILGVMDVGAYGYSMASNYNSRPRPMEVLIGGGGEEKVIRSRETFEDLMRGMTGFE